jgi:hypothetical protein
MKGGGGRHMCLFFSIQRIFFGKGLSSEVPLCTVQMLLWSLNSLSGQRVLQIVRLTLLFNLRRIFFNTSISVTDSLKMLLRDL